ncbi:hypothetical protein AVEN_221492-1 [Araneus ventricosus]|uniref:Mos1 transposase HTH domain-containing protein n=1 Tax=Araneus ventricosus TaxID=182803 RepID=A0A4Y2E0A5_ARAVE|nr:hypothetical protein AVEN_221492-1 [Araneus ventricosus]
MEILHFEVSFPICLKVSEIAHWICMRGVTRSVTEHLNWFKRVKEGYPTLAIKPRSDSPALVNLKELKGSVEKNPTTSTLKLAEKLRPSKDTMC